MDTESIIRKALGLLGEMAKSPEWETILRGLEPEKLMKFESLVAEIEKAETDLQLVTKSHEIICFVEDTEALRKILIQKPRKAVVEAEAAKFPPQATGPMSPADLLAQLTGGGNPLEILQGLAPVDEDGGAKGGLPNVVADASNKQVKDNKPWLMNTVSQIRGLFDRMRNKK